MWGQASREAGAGAAGQGPGGRDRGRCCPSMVPAPQVDELERKVRSQQEQLFLARQELSSATTELKMRASQAEGGHLPTAEGPERGGQGARAP